VDRISDLLIETMEESGYLKDLTRESGEQKIRRLVRRMDLREPDATMWLGMLRQILWKLKGMLR
jgi:tRNA/rRNA methyltransferase